MADYKQKKERLMHQLSSLLEDQLIQNDIPSDLRQEALAMLNKSPVKPCGNQNENENSVCFDVSELGSTCKSVSLKKYFSKNLTITTNESPKTKTHKKPAKDRSRLNLTNDSRVIRQVSPSPKYVRLSPDAAQRYKYQSSAIQQAMAKVKDIETQKAYLQGKVEEMRHLIFQERSRIDSLKLASKSINQETVHLQKSTSSCENNFVSRRRVYQSLQQEERVLAIQLIGTRRQNEEVRVVISQEQELVSMYKVVLEELKKETKSQSKAKSSSQQDLSTARNILEKAKQNYQLLFRKTQNLIISMDKGIRGILADGRPPKV